MSTDGTTDLESWHGATAPMSWYAGAPIIARWLGAHRVPSDVAATAAAALALRGFDDYRRRAFGLDDALDVAHSFRYAYLCTDTL